MQARPPACEMTEAPLKVVVMMRLKSCCTGVPSANLRAAGTTVQPRRTPVKPAYLLKEHVSIATSSAPAQYVRKQIQKATSDKNKKAILVWHIM